MRHPILRTSQLLCVAGVTALAALARPAPPAPGLLWVSVLGENERADGSWEAADVFAAPERVERVQVSIRPEKAVRVRLEAVTGATTALLHPTRADEALLRPGRIFTFPSPSSFYEIRGEAKLRIVATPERDGGESEAPMSRTTLTRTTHARLSDGAPAAILEKAFAAPPAGSGVLELALHGR